MHPYLLQAESGDDFFYQVQKKKFRNKIAALEAAEFDATKVQWVALDGTWDHDLWTQEPSDPWHLLMSQRCHQLREQYQYLALWYSSGYDSHSILDAFVSNGLPLDEIVIQDRRKMYDDFGETSVAISNANYVKTHVWPNLKIQIVSVDEKLSVEFYRRHKDQWIYGPGHTTGFCKWNPLFEKINPKHLVSADKKSQCRRGDIIGYDKPRVLIHEDCWYAFFTDSMAAEWVGNHWEKFYFSRNLPQLHIKQIWMAVRWFEQHQDLTPDFVHEIQGRNPWSSQYLKSYASYNHAIGRSRIANHSAFSITGSQKQISAGTGENIIQGRRLLEYIKNNVPDVYKIYHDGIRQLESSGASIASRPMLSKFIFVKPLERNCHDL
jgi:hypothetical protein